MKATLTIFVFLSILVVLQGCRVESSNELTKQEQACVDRGGVPIQSVWDSDILADCKFPPQSTN